MNPYTATEKQRLRKRWTRDLINHIVIALNEGEPITELISAVDVPRGLDELSGRMDFRGIDFSHQNLRGPWKTGKKGRCRSGISLINADFSCADLSWVILPHADLQGGIFTDADLSYAELISSDLSGADLTGAVMQGVWLLDTKLCDALVTEEQLQSRQNRGQMDFDYRAYIR